MCNKALLVGFFFKIPAEICKFQLPLDVRFPAFGGKQF